LRYRCCRPRSRSRRREVEARHADRAARGALRSRTRQDQSGLPIVDAAVTTAAIAVPRVCGRSPGRRSVPPDRLLVLSATLLGVDWRKSGRSRDRRRRGFRPESLLLRGGALHPCPCARPLLAGGPRTRLACTIKNRNGSGPHSDRDRADRGPHRASSLGGRWRRKPQYATWWPGRRLRSSSARGLTLAKRDERDLIGDLRPRGLEQPVTPSPRLRIEAIAGTKRSRSKKLELAPDPAPEPRSNSYRLTRALLKAGDRPATVPGATVATHPERAPHTRDHAAFDTGCGQSRCASARYAEDTGESLPSLCRKFGVHPALRQALLAWRDRASNDRRDNA